MNNVKKFFCIYGRYLFIFIFIFLIYEFVAYGITYGDPLANYGFSYAIKNGQIPYLEFNTISTPLYAFIMSIGLHFYDSYLMFIIEQSLLVTIMFYFLYKIIDKKSYWVIFGLMFFSFYGLLPTYNFACFLMMVILLYLEKKHNDKDYLIGIFIGLAILSKHTVGAFFILPTIIMYYKNIKKILRRVVGALIPGIIFISYLIYNGAFIQFFNLCFGGLLDFSSKNGNPFNPWFYISVGLFVVMLYILIRNRKDIVNWYLIFTFMFVVPIFDKCHFGLFFGCFLIMVLPYINFSKYDDYLGRLAIILCFTITIINIRIGLMFEPVFMKSFDRFQYTLNSSYSYNKSLKVDKYIKKYDDPLILSYHKLFYDISNGYDLDYFDILMYGNFGYNGTSMMLEKIDDIHDKYIFVDMEVYKNNKVSNQFIKEIPEYVFKNCKKIDSKYGFDIYYKK